MARGLGALQADGWWLRSDVIWNKPNCMPESAHDRPTVSHEHVFLFSKSARYFYDAEAVKELVTGGSHDRGGGVNPKARSEEASMFPGSAFRDGNRRRVCPTVGGWDRTTGRGGHGSIHRAQRSKQNPSFSAACSKLVSRRNLRTVWTISAQPFKGAHFATFPLKLSRICIMAGTSERWACASCGAPWTRIVEVGEPDLEHQRACGGDLNGEYHGQARKDYAAAGAENPAAVKARILAGMRDRKTVGWRKGCKCPDSEPVPCVVLDPFMGAGTTALSAVQLGRKFLGIELNPEYVQMAESRIEPEKRQVKMVMG